MKSGDKCTLTFAGRILPADVVIASANQNSLMLAFDGMLGGYVAQIPLLRDANGDYRDLITGELATVRSAGKECT